ncbi:MAG: FAD-dependent oxidoreductase [Bacteriovoracia bacterium]
MTVGTGSQDLQLGVPPLAEFSFRTRARSLERFQNEKFDLLVIGGGITGAATARDAASRGLKVALVEMRDFAGGTSSRSSKLIHGGLRYLENLEFGLVFEALSERSFLLKTAPHMVRPLPFYMPVYRGDPHGPSIISLGLWFYDLLALFRTPGFHRRLSRDKILYDIPFLKAEGLRGGFRYYDASMWDDALVLETLRSASERGVAIANYVEAIEPIWASPNGPEADRIQGFKVRDHETGQGDIAIRATRTVVCVGPWVDRVGPLLTSQWKPWLNPSKGVHLVFDLKRIPIPGAMVMSHPEDGRISFVIPRPDFGAGVVIVGTTDGMTSSNPDKAEVMRADVDYLMKLLQRYFPSLELTEKDIVSTYVGVRPLMSAQASTSGSEGQKGGGGSKSLQKVSREHYIGIGPGGVTVVAGGKYTTHRNMAAEIVDETLQAWRIDQSAGRCAPVPSTLGSSKTDVPVNPRALTESRRAAERQAIAQAISVEPELWERFGAEAMEVARLAKEPLPAGCSAPADPDGFPKLAGQLRYFVRHGMVMHLDDFFFRRLPLFLARADHGAPWVPMLSQVLAQELAAGSAVAEARRVQDEAELRQIHVP